MHGGIAISNCSPLVHVTSSFDQLESICQHGLLYTYNPTEVFDQLLGKGFNHVGASSPGGMICFSELPFDDAKRLLKGCNYGLSVQKEWAVQNGAKPVHYIGPKDNSAFEKLRDQKIQQVASSLSGGITRSEDLTRWLLELAATKPAFTRSMGLAGEYQKLMTQSMWFQSIGHKEEREWRIRSPKGYPNIEVLAEMEQVDMLLRMVRKIPSTRHMIALRIPSFAIARFHVPSGQVDRTHVMLAENGYGECAVNRDVRD